MIILTINRGAGFTFIRSMDWRGLTVCHNIVPGENKMELHLQPSEVDLFRELLIRRPDQFENATGILKMLGHAD